MLNSGKIKAIIVDIDGTLSDDRWRRHLVASGQATWDDIHTMSKYDAPNKWCLDIIDAMHNKGYKIVFVTARNEKYRQDTLNWLNANVVCNYELFMRPELDTSDDWIIKKNLYHSEVEPTHEIEFCLEDKGSVASMWRDIGLVCLHCDGRN